MIASIKSTIDDAVRAARSNVTHQWEVVAIDGVSKEFCKRCGRPKDECKLPDKNYEFLPCRGLIG